ncbi:hypothetical protein GCM10022376_07530 [Yimella lutea]
MTSDALCAEAPPAFASPIPPIAIAPATAKEPVIFMFLMTYPLLWSAGLRTHGRGDGSHTRVGSG